MAVDWRKKLGAHLRGVDPLLVETADHIEGLVGQLEESIALLRDYVRVYPNNSGRAIRFLDQHDKKDDSGPS